jgi:hypothetical protein
MGASGPVASPPIQVMGCFRTEMVRYPEVDASNTTYMHAGGLFKLFVHKTG